MIYLHPQDHSNNREFFPSYRRHISCRKRPKQTIGSNLMSLDSKPLKKILFLKSIKNKIEKIGQNVKIKEFNIMSRKLNVPIE